MNASGEPFHGILSGVTKIPGCEPLPSGDGFASVPDHSFICDMCWGRFPNMDGWVHTYICSVCPECTVEFPSE